MCWPKCRSGANLGGEQSGHIIFGLQQYWGWIVTALKVATIVKATGQSLAGLTAAMPRLAQVQNNVLVSRRREFSTNPRIQEAIHSANAALAGVGRVLVRPSGTEPKVRVLVEGEDKNELEEIAGQLVKVIGEELA